MEAEEWNNNSKAKQNKYFSKVSNPEKSGSHNLFAPKHEQQFVGSTASQPVSQRCCCLFSGFSYSISRVLTKFALNP